MSSTKVLEFVASELEEQILTISSLSAFVAAEKAADKLDMNVTSRQAAQLAVLLPSVPRERICLEFDSETADIFEVLHPRDSFSKIVLVAMTVYGNSGNDKVRRDAAIAVVAAEVAVASPKEAEQMAEWLGHMADHETDPERNDFLKDLRLQLPKPSSAGSQRESLGRATVISISMDICGSTQAKARMRVCAGDNKAQLTEWYEQFHRQFLLSEWKFYSQLFQNGHDGLNWDWKHAFVVKGIGDEIWLLYKVSEANQWKLKSLAARLFHAALNVAATPPIYWTSASDDDPFQQPYETMYLPLKFYIDILDDAYEVSRQRCDFVTERLLGFLDAEESSNKRNFFELGNRLYAGSLLGDGRRLIQTIRTDYIGWEVDRFFRASKFALPMVATVGQNLFKRVFSDPKKSGKSLNGTGLQKAMIEYSTQQGSIRYDNDLRYVKMNIAPKKLKGVGEGYMVYWLLRKNELFGLHDTYADKKIMKKTLDVFTPEMVKAERNLH